MRPHTFVLMVPEMTCIWVREIKNPVAKDIMLLLPVRRWGWLKPLETIILSARG